MGLASCSIRLASGSTSLPSTIMKTAIQIPKHVTSLDINWQPQRHFHRVSKPKGMMISAQSVTY